MRNRWARFGGVLGIVYCVAGFFLIFLGWNGTATYDDVPAQIPYLVSGGLGGLGLIVLGSALIVAQSLRGDRVELREGIDDLRAAVDRLAAGGGAGVGATAAGPAAGEDDTVLAGPTSYHRPSCRVVQGQLDVISMSRREAAADRSPCRVCRPDEPTLTVAS
jgi:hypothetical protein